MTKTPVTAQLLREMQEKFERGEGPHPLASWADHWGGSLSAAQMVGLIELMIYQLPPPTRVQVRRILARRLRHPEASGNAGKTMLFYEEPKPSVGSGQWTDTRCVVCYHPRKAHDIDGQRPDCDGYVGEPG